METRNYSEAQAHAFYRQLLERTGSLPGVQAASLALSVPLSKSSRGTAVEVKDQPLLGTRYNIVTPGYFDTMGIPLLLGRRFSERDNAQSPRVAIISETFARRAWANESPLGKIFSMKFPAGDQSVEVVGVARDTRGGSLFDDSPLFAYLPLAQKYESGMTLHLRAATKPELLLSALRQEIRALDPKLPVYDVRTLEKYRRDYFAKMRIQVLLIGGFGLLALVLASLGLYGVLSYSVAQRSHEIGIRMALGATASDVLRLVVRQGFKLAAIGIALGLAGALAITRILKSLLHGLSPTDPLTFAVISVLLVLVALVACWLPARRVAKVDPMIALRCE
jgi:predicted permease